MSRQPFEKRTEDCTDLTGSIPELVSLARLPLLIPVPAVTMPAATHPWKIIPGTGGDVIDMTPGCVVYPDGHDATVPLTEHADDLNDLYVEIDVSGWRDEVYPPPKIKVGVVGAAEEEGEEESIIEPADFSDGQLTMVRIQINKFDPKAWCGLEQILHDCVLLENFIPLGPGWAPPGAGAGTPKDGFFSWDKENKAYKWIPQSEDAQVQYHNGTEMEVTGALPSAEEDEHIVLTATPAAGQTPASVAWAAISSGLEPGPPNSVLITNSEGELEWISPTAAFQSVTTDTDVKIKWDFKRTL